ncbi:MAG: DUF1150 family protein [Pseudomonadota bacterium]
MNTKYDLNEESGDRIVYVRPVSVADLPDELRDQAGERDHIYAVHSEDGERLAFVKDRKMAFLLASQNNMAPVNVH